MEGPVGGPKKRGLSAVEETWDNANQEGASWTMKPIFVQICGGEAAVHVTNVGLVDGQEIIIESLEFWQFGETGRVKGLRTFFAPPGGVELDPFFSKVDS
jgi:hypothetical protein